MDIALYKAAEEVRHMLENIDPETGEMPDGFEQARAIVATKSKAVAAFILENELQAKMIEQHAKDLLSRVKAANRRNEWLREYLKSHMRACGIESIKSDDGTFNVMLSIGRDKSVEVFQPELLPESFMRVIPAKQEPDKTAIKAAFDDGINVPGARVVSKDRLTIK